MENNKIIIYFAAPLVFNIILPFMCMLVMKPISLKKIAAILFFYDMLFVIFHLVSFWLGMESIISVNGLNAHDLFDFSDMNDFKKSVLIYCAKYCAEIIFFTGVLPYILSLILFIKAPFTKDIIPREYKKNGTSAEAIVAGKPDPSLLSRYKYIYVGVDYDIDKYGIISGEEDITEELNDKIYVLPHRYNLKNAQKVKILYIPEKKKCYLL